MIGQQLTINNPCCCTNNNNHCPFTKFSGIYCFSKSLRILLDCCANSVLLRFSFLSKWTLVRYVSLKSTLLPSYFSLVDTSESLQIHIATLQTTSLAALLAYTDHTDTVSAVPYNSTTHPIHSTHTQTHGCCSWLRSTKCKQRANHFSTTRPFSRIVLQAL